nr:class II aldolase/adducin family protein [uncultured Rhodopila sp.]
MIRASVARLFTNMGARGLIVGGSGNVSGRTPDGMLITPTGGDPQSVAAMDLAAVTLDGFPLNDASASSEQPMHSAVYRTVPDAAFIVHTHADACTALACLGLDLPPFHYMVLQFGGNDVRCAPYVTFGTQALADHAAAAIEGRSACLLSNHGMIVCGPSVEQTIDRAVQLETLCRQYLLALAAGKPRLLTDEQIEAAKERFKTYRQREAAICD